MILFEFQALKGQFMKILIVILVILAILAALAGNIMSHVDQPKYKVIGSENNIEVREYEPMLLAEVEVSGERKEASLRERLALCIGMFPRGEVGAGVLVVSMAYGLSGMPLTVAVFSLALNLLLTGLFIIGEKKLIGAQT